MCVCVCVFARVSVGAVAQLVREFIWGMKASVSCKVAGSSHSDGEIWHNFLKQEN